MKFFNFKGIRITYIQKKKEKKKGIRIDMKYCFELEAFESFNLHHYANPISSNDPYLSILPKLVPLLI